MNLCVWCDEPVEPGEQHPYFRRRMHMECGFRMSCGSVAHIERRCHCYVPGSTECDPPGMTKRQAARAAMDAYNLAHCRARAAGRN